MRKKQTDGGWKMLHNYFVDWDFPKENTLLSKVSTLSVQKCSIRGNIYTNYFFQPFHSQMNLMNGIQHKSSVGMYLYHQSR